MLPRRAGAPGGGARRTSASEPDTIVADVEHIAQPKNHLGSCSSETPFMKSCSPPTTQSRVRARSDSSLPYAIVQPIAHHESVETIESIRFLIRIALVFFERTVPASTSAKPSCITKQSTPPISPHR